MSFINMDKRFKISKMLIDNYILILLMLVIATHRGANAFGYDSAASCNPNGKLSRRGRAQMLAAIPCDLTRQAYCNLPGAAYPWHAVRRFVHENQGLMKRMYGDMRHISVLRDEIQNNDIDIEDIEIAAERYSRDGSRRSAKFMQQRGEDYSIGGSSSNLKNNDIIMEPHFRPMTTTSTTTTTTERTSVNGGSKPVEKERESTTQNVKRSDQKVAHTADGLASKDTDKSNEQSKSNGNERLKDTKIEVKFEDSNLASNSVYEVPTLSTNELLSTSPTNRGENIEIIKSPQLNWELKNLTELAATISTTLKVSKVPSPLTTTTTSTTPKPNSQTTTTTRRPVTLDYQRRRPQYPYRQRPQYQQQQQLHAISTKGSAPTVTSDTERISSVPSPAPSSSPLSTATQLTSSLKVIHSQDSQRPSNSNSPTERPPTTSAAYFASTLSPDSTAFTFVKPKIELLSGEKLQKPPTTPASKPSTVPPTASVTKPPVLRDGQLFQDTIKQEPTPMVNLRGVNACPVKEEVVAPFWANNTRGEVLALLNLYPFEQYVHWEKCTHEHKQMYCRDGCRCEQQYRLHRLLAYDPRNECRGIFSDWFRFPSCCICKCYNIPVDFRATSRSPRMQSYNDEPVLDDDRQNPLEVAEEEVKRAIYEHATEEWYRPRDDYDNLES